MATKTRRMMRAGLAAAMLLSAGAPMALAQEDKSGLEAMGSDPAESGKEDPAATPAPSPAATPEAAAPAAPIGEGQAIMERARDRIKRAQYVSFDAHMFGVGAMAGYTTEATGRVVARRAAANATNPWMFRVSGSTAVKDGATPTNFDMAMRATSREWINHDERTVHETLKMSPGGKWLTTPNSLWPSEVFERVPYTRVFRNATFQQEAGQVLDGVECDVVVVESKPLRGAASKTRWFIGRDDMFPRRFERLITMEGSETQLVLDFTNVRIADSVPDDVTDAMLRVEVPAGYEEKRQTPPTLPPPAPAPTPADPTPLPTDAGAMNVDGTMDPANGAASPTASPVEPVRPAPPAMAPDFELAKLDGTKVSLTSLRGSVVVVDFFGTWAMAAEAWHPQLKTIIAANEGVKLVPVSIRQREPQLAAELLRRAEIADALLVGNEAVAQAYRVQVYPAAAVIAADGRLIEVVQGCGSAASEESLRAAISRAMGTPATSDAPSNTPTDASPTDVNPAETTPIQPATVPAVQPSDAPPEPVKEPAQEPSK